MVRSLLIIVALTYLTPVGFCQTIRTNLPKPISKNGKYLFYLHGGVVTVHGDHGVNDSHPEWGQYEYYNILDSLKKRGYNVISEIRKPGVDDMDYVNKISNQVDSLLNANVPEKNIILVGASAGGNIVIHSSAKIKKKNIHYVIIGACRSETYKEYESLILTGKFLSIIEISDPHDTCQRIFTGREASASFHELQLNMGLSHGFIYKGYKEWIDPIVDWTRSK